jgi:hypothetical protein
MEGNMKQETMRRCVGSVIEIRSGSEGPAHDPYGYTETTVTRADGRWATIHSGLGDWMLYFDGRQERRFDDDYAILRNKFEACVGITPEGAEKAMRKVQDVRVRNHACGPNNFEWVSGYPGEELLACGKCGHIIDSSFNVSAVI